MRSSKLRLTIAGAGVGRIVIAIAFTAAISALPARPAYADHDDRQAQYDRHDEGDRDSRDGRGNEHERRPAHHHRYAVYAPPPAYYPQRASPGITLFFPLEIR